MILDCYNVSGEASDASYIAQWYCTDKFTSNALVNLTLPYHSCYLTCSNSSI